MANHHWPPRNHDNDFDLAAFRRFAVMQRQNQLNVADAPFPVAPRGHMAVRGRGALLHRHIAMIERERIAAAAVHGPRSDRMVVQENVLRYVGV